jgi:hypothetical protein
MPLAELKLPIGPTRVPADVRSFLRAARRRIARLDQSCHIPGFIPSNYERVYAALHALAEMGLAPGNLFCEWGSGIGVVACLAAMLDFDACGIEIEPELVDTARNLAEEFGLPVEFAHGSFIPRRARGCLDTGDGFAWLTTDGGDGHEELGLSPDAFDVIFIYPWPDEERMVARLFGRYAASGALLLTHHACEDFRLRRKLS